MSYSGKYALAKHETLALKCEALECQLEEARKKIDIQKGHLELAVSLSDDPNTKLLCTALLEQLKEKGDE